MGDATKQYFLKVFGETLDILREESIPYLVIGSIANTALLGHDWDPASDIDLIVTKPDAEKCMDVFPPRGYSTHVRDPNWIHKVAKPNVVIDLIFVAASKVELDEEMLDRGRVKPFETLEIPVASTEDMALLFALMDSEERRGYWYDAMEHLRNVEDWDYLVRRATRYAPVKMLSALLYARETGIDVPDNAVDRLQRERSPSPA